MPPWVKGLGKCEDALKMAVSAEVTDERVLAAYEDNDVSICKIRSDRLGTSELRNQGDRSISLPVASVHFDAINYQRVMENEITAFS